MNKYVTWKKSWNKKFPIFFGNFDFLFQVPWFVHYKIAISKFRIFKIFKFLISGEFLFFIPSIILIHIQYLNQISASSFRRLGILQNAKPGLGILQNAWFSRLPVTYIYFLRYTYIYIYDNENHTFQLQQHWRFHGPSFWAIFWSDNIIFTVWWSDQNFMEFIVNSAGKYGRGPIATSNIYMTP